MSRNFLEKILDDTKKTKAQLIAELEELRKQVSGSDNPSTDNKPADQRTNESDQRYRNIIEQSFDGISLVNDKGKIIEWNKAQERITCLKQNEVLGKYVWDIQIKLAPENLRISKFKQTLKDGFFKALKNKTNVEILQEQQIFCRNGDTRNVQSVSFKILNNNSVMIATIMRDITEKKNAQKSLRKSIERLDLAMSVANDGLWDWDLTTNTVYFDPRYYTMAGYKINEFPHKLEEFQKRVHPDDIDYVMNTADNYLKGKLKKSM